MSETEALVFTSDPVRRSKILRLTASGNPANDFWFNLFLYGKWAYFILSAILLALFGVVIQSPVLLLLSWCAVSAIGVPVLLLALYRTRRGSDSCWHKFQSEKLSFEADAVVFSAAMGPIKNPVEYVWSIPYKSVTHIEYERSSKFLRLRGSCDDEASRKPDPFCGLPKGMCERPENSAAVGVYLEIPMYFKDSNGILELFQQKTGIYIHPAMRADDIVDLRDLQGLEKEAETVRPMLLGLAVCSLVFLLSAWAIRAYRSNNPFAPFPATDHALLTKTFGLGDSVTLDGCEITLHSLKASGSSIEARITITNSGDLPVGFQWHNSANLEVYALYSSGKSVLCELSEPSERLVRLDPGALYEPVCVITPPDEKPAGYLLRFNSDDWYMRRGFWQQAYKGYPLTVDGTVVQSNVISFAVQLS